ncbi:histidinol dehydrogenase [Candidatus Aerophobetes bacterium Ae_b3a]|nr:MAG: histidinol dehydrogenase [Candidatus Aerophobetes bacterium Ae_b3a]
MRQPQRLGDLDKDEYQRILRRAAVKTESILSVIIPIVKEVEKRGDAAVTKFTAQFDGVDLAPKDFQVSQKRVKAAYEKVSPELIVSLKKMHQQVWDFHQRQKREDWSIDKFFLNKKEAHYKLGQRFIPVERAGVYVPGGRASYPSTAIMAIVPAKIAAVKNIIVVSPPSLKREMADAIMVAADIAGADLMFNIGGVQAIAALAYGTSTIPQVDIAVGPGNAYVQAAKAYLFSLGKVAIDSPAGPSEILIIADDSANYEYIARDILSQTEHAGDNCAILITTSEQLAERVYKYLKGEVSHCLRKAFIEKSLADYGAILIADSLNEAIQFANDFAPEHLEIMTKNPDDVFKNIKNAGSVFLGDYSPVAAADYLSGTNHILPTGGSAKRFSGLSVETFLKSMTYQSLSKGALKLMSSDITNLASSEGPYTEHIRSVKIREERL